MGRGNRPICAHLFAVVLHLFLSPLPSLCSPRFSTVIPFVPLLTGDSDQERATASSCFCSTMAYLTSVWSLGLQLALSLRSLDFVAESFGHSHIVVSCTVKGVYWATDFSLPE